MPPKKSESGKRNDTKITKNGSINEAKEIKEVKSKEIKDNNNNKNDKKSIDKTYDKGVKEIKGKIKITEEVLTLKQTKNQRKAINAAIEAERLDSRDRMENMSLVSDEEEHVFTTMKVLENSLGNNGVMRDAFGNTISKR